MVCNTSIHPRAPILRIHRVARSSGRVSSAHGLHRGGVGLCGGGRSLGDADGAHAHQQRQRVAAVRGLRRGIGFGGWTAGRGCSWLIGGSGCRRLRRLANVARIRCLHPAALLLTLLVRCSSAEGTAHGSRWERERVELRCGSWWHPKARPCRGSAHPALYRIGKQPAIKCHIRTIRPQSRIKKLRLNGCPSVRRGRASFRCGQMSVRREAANVLPIIVGIRDGAVQLVSTLGSVVISA
jgi:hypothetical protein